MTSLVATMRFIALDKLINLHDGYIRHCRVEFHNLLLLQRQGDCFVIESLCPHREHPLDVAAIENGILACALHGYRFELTSGGCYPPVKSLVGRYGCGPWFIEKPTWA